MNQGAGRSVSQNEENLDFLMNLNSRAKSSIDGRGASNIIPNGSQDAAILVEEDENNLSFEESGENNLDNLLDRQPNSKKNSLLLQQNFLTNLSQDSKKNPNSKVYYINIRISV